MNCSGHDLRDYFFEELGQAERRQVEAHVSSCEHCRGELARLRATQSALLAVRDEEVPQRIGFVSDRVYEPSVIRRGWRAFWNSGPRLVFASAAMLSVALVVSPMIRPTTVAAPIVAVDDGRLRGEISRQAAAIVEKAVDASERRQEQKTVELLAASERTHKQERSEDIRAVSKAFEYLNKRVVSVYRASVDWSEPR